MSETSQDTLFGRMAIEQRLCTEEELQRCHKELRHRVKANEAATVEQLLQEYGFITATQASRLKDNIKDSKDAAGKIPGYKILASSARGPWPRSSRPSSSAWTASWPIKVLPEAIQREPRVRRAVLQGRPAAAKLNHNNIVQAIDVGEAGGYHYFVMEYVEGKTLYDDLAKGKVFDEAEALDIIIQIANALWSTPTSAASSTAT